MSRNICIDILGVSEITRNEYRNQVRALATSLGLESVAFKTISDLLRLFDCPVELYTTDELLRRLILFKPPEFDVARKIKEDNNVARVYRGFIKFLEMDMQENKYFAGFSRTARKKQFAEMAKVMILRGMV
jgi:pyoverdine/dityrosine biosynthesis protein Dit1